MSNVTVSVVNKVQSNWMQKSECANIKPTLPKSKYVQAKHSADINIV